MTGNYSSNETPSWAEIIFEAIEDRLYDLNICMPGTVQAYDPAENLAEVAPDFQRLYADEDSGVDLPIINGVPVAFPRAGKAALTFPIKQGHKVLLVFSQRSLEKWKSNGAKALPGDTRIMHISDAVAIPGVYPVNDSVVIDPDNLILRFGSAKVTLIEDEEVTIEALNGKLSVTKDGKVTIGNGSIDLLKLVDDTLTEIQKLTVPTAVGPSGVPVNAAAFATIQQQLAQILG